MKRPMFLLITVLSTLLTLSYMFAFAYTTTAEANSTIINSAHGYAFAGYASIPAGSSSIAYGPVSELWFGCSNKAVQLNSGAATLSLGSYSNSGHAQTAITTTEGGTSDVAQTLVSVQGVNVLSGLITASQLEGEVASTITATNATSSVVEALFSGLTIAGNAINGTPGPNTTVQIANLGYVVLNETGITNGADYSYAGINMIDLYVTHANSQGLPVGARIVIGDVNSSQQRLAQPTYVEAHSYGFNVITQSGNGSASSTPSAAANLNCTGGTAQNSVAGVSSQQVGSAGAVKDSVSGQIASPTTKATSVANVVNPNLLAGLVHGSAVTATANAMYNGSSSGSASTQLVNLTIAGIPVSRSPAANTRLSLLGFGYAVLNEQTHSFNASGASETVNGVDIYITQKNVMGIPIGTQIILGHATASVYGMN